MRPALIGRPHAERAVLGACFGHRRVIPKVLAALGPEAFVDPRHRVIRDAIETVHGKGATVDALTVHAVLEARGHARLVGGMETVEAISTSIEDGGLDAHMQLVHDAHRVRLVRDAAIELAKRGSNPAVLDEPEAYVADATRVADAARKQITRAAMPASIGVCSAFESAVMRGKAKREPACPFGLASLDELLLGGLRSKRLYVIGAGSGVGKTSLMSTAIIHSATEFEHPHIVFSLEMDAEELFGRLIYGHARVPSVAWERGLSSVQLHSCMQSAEVLRRSPIWIDDTTTHWPSIEARSEAWLYEETDVDDPERPVPVIWVDYVQLATCKAESREREIASMSRGAKLLAKRTGAAVVLLAQLNDEYRKAGRPPRKSDLRECKAVGHDADAVILADTDDKILGKDKRPTTAIVDKQRQGPRGTADLTFIGSQTRFEDGLAW